MAYIGKTPVIGNFVKLDAITAVNGQAAYTMQNGGSNFTDYESVNQFLVSLNGTIQAPTDSFTVSGSTLTFASNLSTGDVIDFIMVFGNSLSAGTPTDATVSTAKIVDDAVTAAKINNDIISGSTELASEPADTDEFLVSDAGTLKRIDYSLIKPSSDFVKLASSSNVNAASIDFNGYFSSDYSVYKVFVVDLEFGNNAADILALRFATGSYSVSTANYSNATIMAYTDYNGTVGTGSNTGGNYNADKMRLGRTTSGTGSSNTHSQYEITIYAPSTTGFKSVFCNFTNYEANTYNIYMPGFTGGYWENTAAVTGFRLLTSGGENIIASNIALYGIKK
jgi:hypothetical protein